MKYSIPLTSLFISCMLLSESQRPRADHSSIHKCITTSPVGLYDPLALREMHVTFEDEEYHATLVDAFFNNPSLRIPATVELDGVVLDSIGARVQRELHFLLAQRQREPKSSIQPRFQLLDSRARLHGLQ